MPRYFAYGSNLSRARLEARVERVRVVGPAVLEGHRHRFSKRGEDGTGKGNVETMVGDPTQSGRARVWGVVYDLDPAQLARLTTFETGYQPERLVVRSSAGDGLEVHSYRALRIVEGLEPTRDYLGHYLTGMREHALPEDYLDEVLGQWRELLKP